jgi:hypothetical protein
MFLYWRTNYFSEQRFCQQTRFRMICSRSSDGTAVAINKMFSILFAKSGRATELFENAECGIDSLFATFAFQTVHVFLRHLSARGPHSGAQVLGPDLAGEYRHQEGNQSAVCLRKKMLGFRTKGIGRVRFANARLHAGLHSKSVTFQAGEMRPDSVVREVQLVRQLVNRTVARAQKIENLAAGAFEKPLAPAYIFN